MSQLATAPRTQSAKQLQKLRHIKKVKTAIRWHERQRKQRQALTQERYEAKRAAIDRVKWHNEHVRNKVKESRQRAREDWKLGPLRPNRAVGADAATYGALAGEEVQRPAIPVKALEKRNQVREKKGLELDYPLVVNEKKYFPIVKGDRVVVTKGKDRHRIGVVKDVNERSHELTVTGMNKHYVDTRAFAVGGLEKTRAMEVPYPISDVRLVIPYSVTNRVNSNMVQIEREIQEDVIVDKIFMERHTTGIDPFTGVDYGNDTIPEEHQFDPETGNAIFHRYIAGTRHRIEWPWELEAAIEDEGKSTDAEPSQGVVRSALHKARHPISTFKEWRAKKNPAPAEAEAAQETELEEAVETPNGPPRGEPVQQPEDIPDVDTTINYVEQGQNLIYSLAYPPHPDSIVTEIRPELHGKEDKADSTSKTTPYVEKQQRLEATEQAKQKALDSMKTPMQLRWELEQAKKGKYDPKAPTAPSDALLAFLGQHMESNGIKLTGKRRKAASNIADVD